MSTRDSEPVYMALPASRLPLSAGEPAVAPPRATAKETPLAVEVNGEPYAVMMVTPSDIEDFAVGFALAERLIAQASDVARIDIREARIRGNRGALAVDIRLDRSAEARVAERRRMLPGNAGCGICGVMTLEEALPELPEIGRAHV